MLIVPCLPVGRATYKQVPLYVGVRVRACVRVSTRYCLHVIICACREQESLKRMLSEEDSLEVLSWRDGGKRFAGLQLVGGVDISFNKSNPDEACAIVVVLSFPQLQVTLLQG